MPETDKLPTLLTIAVLMQTHLSNSPPTSYYTPIPLLS